MRFLLYLFSMANITLFSFQLNSTTRITVYRDSFNPTQFDYTSAGTPPSTPGHPPYDIMVASACSGTTRYKYYYRDGNPYVRYETEVNSLVCGYEPPSCDISIVTFEVTDETEEGANNGTVNIFATSSYPPIMYYLYNGDYSFESTTGYFTNVPPGLYQAFGQDAHGCTADHLADVLPFDNTTTHFKYRLQFNSVNNNIAWELRLYDKRNNYDGELYPKDLTGTENPVIIKQANQGEAKTTTIVSKTLEINIIFDGETFTTDEFTLADPYKWFVELYKGGELEFQGWLLPDEIQDLYADPSYPFQLIATDGLPNLKGNTWGDGSGGNGYTDDQVQQYGLKQWSKLVKQCLDQLGYDYGRVIFVSSLRYNNTFNGNLWTELGCWGDLLYDTNGKAIGTYDALEVLLSGMKLRIIQHKGQFIFYNENDLFYANKSISLTEYNRAFYEVQLWDNLSINGIAVEHPVTQLVGFDAPIVPYNPPQSLNYDKSYNIKTDIDFDILALLYTNPSFEIGAVEGELPTGFTKNNSDFSAFLHEGDAYDGDWVFRIEWNYQLALRYAELATPGIFIDQPNKVANFSIVWRSANKPPSGYITIAYRMIFTVQSTGGAYIFSSYGTVDDPTPRWLGYSPSFFTNAKEYITDLVGWNAHTVTSTRLPEDGIGWLNIWLNAPQAVNDNLDLVGIPGEFMSIDYDNFQLSVSDADVAYSKQIGETHTTQIVTNVADVKTLDLALFTYPNNKRIAGNIFIGHDYTTSEVGNKWNFALKPIDPMDRLPATITRAFGRTYSRSMHIFEGDVQAQYLQYYGTFQLTWYESRVFVALSIELDCRNETGHVVLIEISDEDAQFIYKYNPKFERTARRLN